MNPEAVKQILDTIQQGGTVALNGIAANAVMQAWGGIGIMILLILITLAMGGLLRWFIKKTMACKSYDDNEGWLIGSVISGILTLVMFICTLVGISSLPSEIATIQNPQAAAIRILIGR
jgi:hypothetical protein